jgi:hypothetical protein
VASLTASVLKLSSIKKKEKGVSVAKTPVEEGYVFSNPLEQEVAEMRLQLKSFASQMTQVLDVLIPEKQTLSKSCSSSIVRPLPQRHLSQGRFGLSELSSNTANGDGNESEEEDFGQDDCSSVRSLISGVASIGHGPVVTYEQKSVDAGLHWFVSTYAEDSRFQSHSKPLSPMDITRLKAAGVFCNITVLFQLGISRPSARNGNEFLSATTCEYLGSIPEHLKSMADVQLGDSLPYCFPVNPEYLIAFLDLSISDVNAGHQLVERRYRSNTSAKISALTEYKQNMLRLLHNVFGDSSSIIPIRHGLSIMV